MTGLDPGIVIAERTCSASRPALTGGYLHPKYSPSLFWTVPMRLDGLPIRNLF